MSSPLLPAPHRSSACCRLLFGAFPSKHGPSIALSLDPEPFPLLSTLHIAILFHSWPGLNPWRGGYILAPSGAIPPAPFSFLPFFRLIKLLFFKSFFEKPLRASPAHFKSKHKHYVHHLHTFTSLRDLVPRFHLHERHRPGHSWSIFASRFQFRVSEA